ncbi:phosphohydrolase [Niastella yeongjuensis]|uniref:Phosphohydrolase n=1 Tax=Niastella yeongjuensis TaxID=354355 RepID=A0A1V9EF75_9BACT|nr:HD domain-containing protein [Niastella yeongjuensis]OQP44575.1 phosphohydrolase [Niastella yeongjuensis]SEO82729.1 phosphonate degradation operons associated HDIG domain protein [Niastella yeongjuensis]
MNSIQATNIANEIIQLYKQYGGSEYAGEKVTQLEHMVQAARLAEKEGYEEEVILAAFLHDIGHICVAAQEHNAMGGWGIKDHEAIGADFLREKGFSKRLSRLVESHVEAKRYLTWKDPLYFEQLSEASKKTLEYQGGPMLTDEAFAFEQHPLFHLIVQMRHWDDVAKVEFLQVGELDRYREMIVRHLITV